DDLVTGVQTCALPISAMHYLKAVDAKKTDAAEEVLKQMRDTPVNDFFAKDGKIRADGRMVHDMYLAEVKKPAESKSEWDMVRIRSEERSVGKEGRVGG